MNENKSEAIVVRSPSLRTPITFIRINICGQFVDTSAVIRDLGFVFDAALTISYLELLRYETLLLPVYAKV